MNNMDITTKTRFFYKPCCQLCSSQSPKAAAEEPKLEPEPDPGLIKEPPPELPKKLPKTKGEAAAKMVKVIGNLVKFQSELDSTAGKLIVIDFSITWCGPCKMIKPFFYSLVEKYKYVIFIEIDVDDVQDVAAHSEVKSMQHSSSTKTRKKCMNFPEQTTKGWKKPLRS
uniref:Thioredoxin domain-containing protein n=1 Tax=Anolis carolinensis TaxID=28377 RepID=A0A803SXX7_ANOCA